MAVTEVTEGQVHTPLVGPAVMPCWGAQADRMEAVAVVKVTTVLQG